MVQLANISISCNYKTLNTPKDVLPFTRYRISVQVKFKGLGHRRFPSPDRPVSLAWS